MPVFRHVLDPARPLVDTVAEVLLPPQIDGPVSLGDTWILVPTAQAGRRLREHLARRCAAADTALLDATIITPAHLFRPVSQQPLASSLEQRMAWAVALEQLGTASLSRLFPEPPEPETTAWRLGQATQLMRLRDQLADIDACIGEIPERLGEALPGPGRWSDLTRLETAYLEQVQRWQLADPANAKRSAAGTPTLPPEVTRVVVAAVPDPPGLAVQALECLAETLPVDILLPCLPDELDRFDAWGRPEPAYWAHTDIGIPGGEVQLADGPAEMAARVYEHLARAAEQGAAPADMALAVPDTHASAAIADHLHHRGLRAADPAGIPLSALRITPLLDALLTFAGTDRFASTLQLLRQPAVATSLASQCELSVTRYLKHVDRLHQDHLPIDLAAARSLVHAEHPRAALRPALDALADWRERLTAPRPHPVAVLRDLLRDLVGNSPVDLTTPDGRLLAQGVERVNSLCEDLLALGPDLPTEAALYLMRQELDSAEVEPGTDEADLLLEGWLELPWNPAPHLIVAGLNEGHIPDGRLDDPYLPDRLRQALGLRHDATRHARDAHLLHTVLRQRSDGYRALLVARTNRAGDPLKPSRLIFQGIDPATRIQRARDLFRETGSETPVPPRHTPFPLDPTGVLALHDAPFERISVTAFSGYLACPFRFFLSRVGGTDAVDPGKFEPDPRDYGHLVHAALQRMGEDERMQGETDPDKVARFLEDALADEVTRRYGRRPALPIRHLQASARDRLTHLAARQAAWAEEGWRIVATEHKVRLPFAEGITLSGVIDRIDVHPDGRIRVIDYKTKDNPDPPAKTHLRGTRAASDYPAWQVVERPGNKKPVLKRWTDLQLPLYVWIVRHDPELQERCGRGPVEPGYILLPKALTEVDWYPFENWDEALYESGVACAEAVVAAIQARRFWPPASGVRYDDLEPWLHQELEDVFDAEAFAAWMAEAPA